MLKLNKKTILKILNVKIIGHYHLTSLTYKHKYILPHITYKTTKYTFPFRTRLSSTCSTENSSSTASACLADMMNLYIRCK